MCLLCVRCTAVHLLGCTAACVLAGVPAGPGVPVYTQEWCWHTQGTPGGAWHALGGCALTCGRGKVDAAGAERQASSDMQLRPSGLIHWTLGVDELLLLQLT